MAEWGEKEKGAPKRYKCDECGATFVDQKMFEKHKAVHTAGSGSAQKGEEPRAPPLRAGP